MKTKSILCLFILVQICFLKINAQKKGGSQSQISRQYQTTMHLFKKIKKIANEKKNTTYKFEDIKGSPYLYPEPKLGKLFIEDSLIETNYFKFNLYSDEIEVTENNQLYGILKVKNTKLILNNQAIYLKPYMDKEDTKKESYFFTVWKGKNLSLFQKKDCKLVPPLEAATPNQKDRDAKFVVYDSYYVMTPKNDVLLKIKNTKNAILQFMSDNKKEIKQFINDKNINLKESDDLAKLFSYYESIRTL